MKVTSLKLNNDVNMPAFGLGVYQSAPDDTVVAVKTALEVGYRLIDTAAAYMNEQQVGEGIRAGGVDRKDVFVTTKLWMSDYGYDRTLHAFERSLRHLGTDYVDLYLLHWPVPRQFEKTVASWKAVEKILRDGRTRAVGICNASPSHLERLIAETGMVPAVNQVELHPFFTQPDVRAADARLGIVTQSWSPIGGVKRYWRVTETSGDPLQHPVITRLAGKYGKTPAQIALRWQIELGNAVIPKSVHAERIRENADIFDFALQKDEVSAISALDTGQRGGPNPEEVDPTMFDFAIPD